MPSPRFEACLLEQKKRIDESLERLLPKPEEAPAILHESMRYSVFAGGKRLRPSWRCLPMRSAADTTKRSCRSCVVWS
jgi:geranylgeranyl pyrophosphate synthase